VLSDWFVEYYWNYFRYNSGCASFFPLKGGVQQVVVFVVDIAMKLQAARNEKYAGRQIGNDRDDDRALW
jgi:hypothetical protein